MKKPVSLLLLALLAGIGCSRDDVRSVRIDKAGTAAPEAAPAAAMPAASNAALPPPPAPMTGLRWTLPKGWTALPAEGMRFATLKPAGGGTAEVSVVVLSGEAGGELANVNRWRSQLGLPVTEEAALAGMRKVVKAKAGAVSVYTFTNSGSRMVVGFLAASDGNTWFLKLLGNDAAVGQATPDFMKLLGTLNLG